MLHFIIIIIIMYLDMCLYHSSQLSLQTQRNKLAMESNNWTVNVEPGGP